MINCFGGLSIQVQVRAVLGSAGAAVWESSSSIAQKRVGNERHNCLGLLALKRAFALAQKELILGLSFETIAAFIRSALTH
jgi:hypothetical protein